MKKILAMALVLCMVLAMVPATAMAEETHTHCACAHAFTGLDADKCETHNEGQNWTALDPANLPTSGYYYLTADLVLTAQWKITGDLHICTNGYDITRSTTAAEDLFGLIRVDNNKSLSITNCKAEVANGKLVRTDAAKNSVLGGAKSSATCGALIHLNKAAALKLYGVEVSNNETSSTNTSGWGAGAILACDSDITIDIAYSAFCNNKSTAVNGGALSIRGGNAAIRNTVFSGNYAEKSGAAIYMCNAVTSVEITNCDFTDNEAKNGEGGAALYVGKGSAILTNVTMTGNRSSGTHGSAITQNAGTTLRLNSCNITGNNNTSNDKRAAVVVIGPVTEISVSGNTVISGNTNNKKEQNLFLRNYNGQPKLTVGALTAGAKISMYTIDDLEPSDYLIFTDKTPAFTASDEYLIYENRLDEDDKSYGIGYNGSSFAYGVVSHYHADCACAITGVTCKDHTSADATAVSWTPWDAKASANYKTTLPTSGNYYLTDNVTLTGNTTLGGNTNPANIHICTNGYDITYEYGATASEPIRLFNGNLTITNCKAQIKDGKLDTTDPAKTSTISGGETTAQSAGFFRLDTGSLELFGLEFKDNETSSTNDTWTAGVVLATKAESNLVVAYSAFNENHALTKRAGVFSLLNGTADIRNTTFKGNTSATDGAAMHIGGATATLVDCLFEENISGSSGTVYLRANGKAYMTNVTMTANQNNGSNGSAITCENGTTLTLNSCNITENTNVGEGMRAAIVTIDIVTLTVTGNTVVDNNTNKGVERNILLRNWSGTGQPKLTVGQLTEGANISVETADKTAVVALDDPDTILTKNFTGDYQQGWISCRVGCPVGYNADDGFFFGTKTEGNVTYAPWTAGNALPGASGNYYLANDVSLSENADLSQVQMKLHLNGKTVTGNVGEIMNLTIVGDGGSINGKLILADGGMITSDCGITVDINGKEGLVNAPEVALIDSATDNGDVGGKVYGTFDLADTVTKFNGISYLALPGESGSYTANAVRVAVTKVNVRPSAAGIYYTTEFKFNKNVVDAGATYGVVLSLQEKPGADFMAGAKGEAWTVGAAPAAGKNFASTGNSCLVKNIFKDVTPEENAARGAADIYANAYVKIGDTVVMAENTADVVYSMKTVMEALNEKFGQLDDGTAQKVVNFYKDWTTAMASWSVANIAEAAK